MKTKQIVLSTVALAVATSFASNLAQAVTADDVVCIQCVGATDIAPLSIRTGKIVNLAVTGAKIANQAITAIKIRPNAVRTVKIENGAVTSAKVADNSLTAADLSANSVGASELAPNSVYSVDIVDGQVLNTDIGNGQVNSIKITDNSVTAVDLASNSVGSSELAVNSVYSVDIVDGQVTAADLATNSVYAAEIATGAVGQSEIATNGVASAEVQDNTLTHLDLRNEAGVEYFQWASNGNADVGNPINTWQASYTIFVTAPTTGYVTCTASVTAEWDISSSATFYVGWDQDNTAHVVAPDSYTRVALPLLATNSATEIPMNPMHTYSVTAGTHSYTLKLLQSGGGVSDIDLVRRSLACMFFPMRY